MLRDGSPRALVQGLKYLTLVIRVLVTHSSVKHSSCLHSNDWHREPAESVRGLSDCRRSPHHQWTHHSREIRQQWGWLGLINPLAPSNFTQGSVTAVWTDGARESCPPPPIPRVRVPHGAFGAHSAQQTRSVGIPSAGSKLPRVVFELVTCLVYALMPGPTLRRACLSPASFHNTLPHKNNWFI